ncbi:hypothetical protein EGP99_00330 [bacterium]|nr:hypothetical protein [bacterium]
MEYFIGENKELFVPDKKIGQGFEGVVYLNKKSNEAVKIFSKYNKLNIETAEKMTQIHTKYILLPRRLVFDEFDNYAGYTTKYIETNKPMTSSTLVNYPIIYLLYLFSKLYKEVDLISNHKLLLADLENPDNYIYNGNFYLVDPGYYHFVGNSYESVLGKNIDTINRFLLSYGLNYDNEEIEKFLKKLNNSYTVCDYLRDTGSIFESYTSLTRKRK